MLSKNLLALALNKYKSLIEMSPKVPAKDKESLSLVYTPGVAQACKTIQEKPEEVYNLTNKGNSMLIITDGSENPSGDARNYHWLPYLETMAVYYKQLVNVDIYPLILDRNQTKSIDSVYEVLDNLTPGFSGYELFGFEKSRAEKLAELSQQNALGTFLLIPTVKAQIKEVLRTQLRDDLVKSNALAAGLIRAALDCQVYNTITIDTVTRFAKAISKQADLLSKDNYYEITKQAVFEATTLFESEGLIKNKSMNAERVREKLDRFYIEGPQSWLKHSAYDYLDERHNFKDNAVELHRVHVGVTNLKPKLSLKDIASFSHFFKKENLEEVRDFILEDPPRNAYDATMKNNVCAIITNGTAILGLGDIGPEAGQPVMEGKSVLFKQLSGVDVVPLPIKEKDADKAISLISRFGHTFAAINLEDIKAPSCFKIETELQKKLDIPVFHDDQHGTAVVALAALLNAVRLSKKKIEEIDIVINGGGAAGLAITELFIASGVKKIIMCDTKGAIYEGRKENMNPQKDKLAKLTNRNNLQGKLEEVIKGADVFLGVSVGGVLTKEMVKSMNEKPIVFAFANPEPEIMPDDAKEAGAYIVATGRSDFANQVNNSLVFPGIFRGAIDIRASTVSVGMQLAAARAIAGLITDKELNPEYIIPGALDYRLPLCVATEVIKMGTKDGVASREIDLELYKENFKYFVLHGGFNPSKNISKHDEPKINTQAK